MMNFHSSNRDDLRSAQKRLQTILKSIDEFRESKGLGKRLPTSWFSSSISGSAPNEHLKNASESISMASQFLEAQLKALKRGRPVSDEKLLRCLERLHRFGLKHFRNIELEDEKFWEALSVDVRGFDEVLTSPNLVRDSVLAHAAATLTGQMVDLTRIQGLLDRNAWKALEPLF